MAGKKNSQLLIVFLFAASFFLLPVRASAQTTAWQGVCVETAADGEQVATIQGLQCLLGNILSVAITIIGLAGLVMFIVGAFTYMIAGTNAQLVEKAKKSITYAVIGLVVALSSFIILNLIAAFTGIPLITQFVIPNSSNVGGPANIHFFGTR